MKQRFVALYLGAVLLALAVAPALAQGNAAPAAQTAAPQNPAPPTPPAPEQPLLVPLGESQPYAIALSVGNLDSSVRWYTELFGFKPVLGPMQSAPGARVAVLERGNFSIELVSLTGSRPRAAALYDPANPVTLRGVFKFGIMVPDLDRAFTALKVRGVSILMPPVDDETLPVRYCVIQDPDGNLIQIFQRVAAR